MANSNPLGFVQIAQPAASALNRNAIVQDMNGAYRYNYQTSSPVTGFVSNPTTGVSMSQPTTLQQPVAYSGYIPKPSPSYGGGSDATADQGSGSVADNPSLGEAAMGVAGVAGAALGGPAAALGMGISSAMGRSAEKGMAGLGVSSLAGLAGLGPVAGFAGLAGLAAKGISALAEAFGFNQTEQGLDTSSSVGVNDGFGGTIDGSGGISTDPAGPNGPDAGVDPGMGPGGVDGSGGASTDPSGPNGGDNGTGGDVGGSASGDNGTGGGDPGGGSGWKNGGFIKGYAKGGEVMPQPQGMMAPPSAPQDPTQQAGPDAQQQQQGPTGDPKVDTIFQMMVQLAPVTDAAAQGDPKAVQQLVSIIQQVVAGPNAQTAGQGSPTGMNPGDGGNTPMIDPQAGGGTTPPMGHKSGGFIAPPSCAHLANGGMAQNNTGFANPPTGFASGGQVGSPTNPAPPPANVQAAMPPSATADNVPAKLSEGEYVLDAATVAFLGVKNIMKLQEQAHQAMSEHLAQQGGVAQQPTSSRGKPPIHQANEQPKQQPPSAPAPGAPSPFLSPTSQAPKPAMSTTGPINRGGLMSP